MPIKLKALSQPTEPTDGLRILITRKPPPTFKGKVIMELSPSKELLYDYIYHNLSWNGYESRFISEMKNNPKSMELIKWLSGFERNGNNNSETVTLICFCPNENQCHRSLVKRMALECLS